MAQRRMLELDAETTKDFELFGTGEPGTGLFDALPSSYNTSRTDHYLAEVLRLIPETRRLEFSLQVLEEEEGLRPAGLV